MNLTEANRLGHQLMKEHGLLDAGWKFKFDRGTKRFGCCHYGTQRITLSRALTELNAEDKVRDTILHEIAHALVGHAHGHDHVWAAKAREIGSDGRQCYRHEDVVAVPQRFKLTCERGCGKVSFMRTAPKTARSCVCGGRRFNVNRQLTVIDTRTGRDVTRRARSEEFTPWRTNSDIFALANEPAPHSSELEIIDTTKKPSLILKRVDNHEWQTKDGAIRFVRGWEDFGEREWAIIRAADGAMFYSGEFLGKDHPLLGGVESFPTLRAAKEAYQT